jgi:hypothetical protein
MTVRSEVSVNTVSVDKRDPIISCSSSAAPDTGNESDL